MNTPLRIGIEAQRLFRARKHGMDIYALELIKALQEIDTINQYYIFAQPGEDEQCIDETKNFHIITQKTLSYPLWEQWTLPDLAKKYSLDLLHCTANTAPLRLKTKLLLTLHDVIFMQKDPQVKGKKGNSYQHFGNMYRKWVVPSVSRKADALLTVSNFQKHEIARVLNVSEQKIQVTYNGVAPHFFEELDESYLAQIRHKYHLPEHFFFFLGNTEPRKNLTGVLKAFHIFQQQNPNLASLVIKGIDETYLMQKLTEEGIQDIRKYIHLVSYLTSEELAALYHLSDCFLFPSFSEGFGIPIIEAMACGTPVITSQTTSMPEISGGATLLINPADAGEMAVAMKQMLCNTALAERFRKAGKSRATSFSWKDTAISTLATYEKITGQISTSHSNVYASY
ncbi:glycosyltransferase family 1 protein [Cytophagaceae bacterium YF14B1]|uniref:Glycosyltransferase family 1 protein n=1 Tax=Xanthocytophaga flava TaxID=3048013 RepID=A0AAE3QLI1_9BACT|nr:glycosyltransferase family 1 protein [Xanthocytophaga flavus]MDJ1479675.1 glycosyltransferase family 1 protein [Xanthocytophaga flavus]